MISTIKAPQNPFSKTFIYFLALLTIVQQIPIAFAYASEPPARIQIGVMELVPQGVDPSTVAAVTEQIRNKLYATGRYTLATPEEMKTLQDKMALSKQIDPSCDVDTCLSEIAEVLGMEQLMAGRIEKNRDTYTIELRLVDTSQKATINTHKEKIVVDESELGTGVEKAASLLVGINQPVRFSDSDREKPIITHTPLEEVSKKEQIVITAKIKDDSALATVNLHYRQVREGNFSTVQMQPNKEGIYEGRIAASEIVSSQNIKYFIEALDTSGNKASDGSVPFPHEIVIKKGKKIAWWMWGLGLAVSAVAISFALGGGGGGAEPSPTPTQDKGFIEIGW